MVHKVETWSNQERETNKYTMSKCTCIVMYVAVVSLSSVYAVSPIEDFEAMVNECLKQNGITMNDLNVALREGDALIIPPCFWGCAFTKAGFLNDQGQYDLDTGLTYVKTFLSDPVGYNKLEKIAKNCESVKDKSVSDGKAGCEMGTLAAACFMEQLKLM